MAAGDTDTTVISAAMVYKLLKQLYCDAGCFPPNNLTQFVYESVFQSNPRFSHVRQTIYQILLLFCIEKYNNCELKSFLSFPEKLS